MDEPHHNGSSSNRNNIALYGIHVLEPLSLYNQQKIDKDSASMEGQHEPILEPQDNNKTIVFKADTNGNRVLDYSASGFYSGSQRFPLLPTRVALAPANNDSVDDTDRIQQTIDKVCSLAPNLRGHRGSVVLREGTFRVSSTLHI